MNKTTNKANWEAAYKHFVKYSGGECRFCDLDAAYCQKFVDYLLSAECYHNGKPMMPTTANNHLVKLKAALRMAYDDGHIKENIAKKQEVAGLSAKDDEKLRDFYTIKERGNWQDPMFSLPCLPTSTALTKACSSASKPSRTLPIQASAVEAASMAIFSGTTSHTPSNNT